MHRNGTFYAGGMTEGSMVGAFAGGVDVFVATLSTPVSNDQKPEGHRQCWTKRVFFALAEMAATAGCLIFRSTEIA